MSKKNSGEGFPPRIKGEYMSNKTYFFCVHNDPEGLWGEFPDFECAMTDGENLADLLKNAADCLESAVMGYQEAGIDLPVPSDIDQLEELKAKCESAVSFVVPVTGYIPGLPARINVTSTADKNRQEIKKTPLKTEGSRCDHKVSGMTADVIKCSLDHQF